jgi:hypothetical protein
MSKGRVAGMIRGVARILTSPSFLLTAIKLTHTIVWGFFVVCIVAVWAFAWSGNLLNATVSIGIVLVEVVVLVLNDFHCPLTPIAARYTDDRRASVSRIERLETALRPRW